MYIFLTLHICIYFCVGYVYICLIIYISLYIFTNIISSSIHSYQKKKKKKPPGTRDKNISNHRPGEKEKISLDKMKEKANLVRPLEKKQGICSQLVKRKLKPAVNAAMLQLQECSTRVEPIIKLT